jgi:uncharacterized protein with GYD domain
LGKYSAQGAAGARKDGYATRVEEGSKAFESVGAKIESWMWLDWTEWDFGFIADVREPDALVRITSLSAATGAFTRVYVSQIHDSDTMDHGISGISYRPPGERS